MAAGSALPRLLAAFGCCSDGSFAGWSAAAEAPRLPLRPLFPGGACTTPDSAGAAAATLWLRPAALWLRAAFAPFDATGFGAGAAAAAGSSRCPPRRVFIVGDRVAAAAMAAGGGGSGRGETVLAFLRPPPLVLIFFSPAAGWSSALPARSGPSSTSDEQPIAPAEIYRTYTEVCTSTNLYQIWIPYTTEQVEGSNSLLRQVRQKRESSHLHSCGTPAPTDSCSRFNKKAQVAKSSVTVQKFLKVMFKKVMVTRTALHLRRYGNKNEHPTTAHNTPLSGRGTFLC